MCIDLELPIYVVMCVCVFVCEGEHDKINKTKKTEKEHSKIARKISQ